MIDELVTQGCIPAGKAELPGNETVPVEKTGYIMVFKDFFTYGFRIPANPFIKSVPADFKA